VLILSLGLHDTVKENQDLAKQTLDNAEKQLNAQNDFAKERLLDKEEKCH
jgi:hypothetical protein